MATSDWRGWVACAGFSEHESAFQSRVRTRRHARTRWRRCRYEGWFGSSSESLLSAFWRRLPPFWDLQFNSKLRPRNPIPCPIRRRLLPSNKYPVPTSQRPRLRFFSFASKPNLDACGGESEKSHLSVRLLCFSTLYFRKSMLTIFLLNSDKEGHLKFVGPSSGLPLLGLLKELKDSDDPSSTQEPWLDPLGEDLKPNITDQRAAERGPTAVAIGDGLWARVRSVLSSELMDELIRGYFSVSNLRASNFPPMARLQEAHLSYFLHSLAYSPHADFPSK